MNKEKFIEKLERFKFLLHANGSHVAGCSLEEIKHIERINNIKLPEHYKIYLSYFGFESGQYLKGTRAFYKDLIPPQSITDNMIELLVENNISPPDNLFAITLHQGYVGSFFILKDSDPDPIVYHYLEGAKIEEQEKFSIIKMRGIEQHIAYWKQSILKKL